MPSLNKVYTFGPTFRAENSNTSRHLAEFWMIEPEIAFADLADNARLAEHFLQSVVSEVMQRCADDLAFFEQRRLRNHRAPTKCQQQTFYLYDLHRSGKFVASQRRKIRISSGWGTDLQSEHERFICEQEVNGPVVITD